MFVNRCLCCVAYKLKNNESFPLACTVSGKELPCFALKPEKVNEVIQLAQRGEVSEEVISALKGGFPLSSSYIDNGFISKMKKDSEELVLSGVVLPQVSEGKELK